MAEQTFEEASAAPVTMSVRNDPSTGDFQVTLSASFDVRGMGDNLISAQAAARKQCADYIKRLSEYTKENFVA